jgi:hypothetical protein
MTFDQLVSDGVNRPELRGELADEARRLRRRADQIRRRHALAEGPPEPGHDEQVSVTASTFDDAAAWLEQAAHLPPQVDPLSGDDAPALQGWDGPAC